MTQLWTRLPRVAKLWTIIFGAITATLTTLGAVAHTLQIAEPYWVVHRAMMRSEIETVNAKFSTEAQQLSVQQIDTQIKIERNERSRVLDKIADRELLLRQTPEMPETVRSAIGEQIRNWRDDVAELNNSIDQLQRARPSRRP